MGYDTFLPRSVLHSLESSDNKDEHLQYHKSHWNPCTYNKQAFVTDGTATR